MTLADNYEHFGPVCSDCGHDQDCHDPRFRVCKVYRCSCDGYARRRGGDDPVL